MNFPETINGRWIDALSDADLRTAEEELRARFTRLDTAERERRGADYQLMRGPEALTHAWMRWSMVNSATRLRGIRVSGRSR